MLLKLHILRCIFGVKYDESEVFWTDLLIYMKHRVALDVVLLCCSVLCADGFGSSSFVL